MNSFIIIAAHYPILFMPVQRVAGLEASKLGANGHYLEEL